MFASRFVNRKVLVTGHTGFKGSWLTHWLLSLGATVSGYALNPEPHERLFDQLELSQRLLHDHRGDICDPTSVCDVITSLQPEFIFHLAAQPLVRKSFEFPVSTFATNVMGTVHLLDAVRQLPQPCVVVAVTTDKCYENREWLHSYREDDAMGGYDPYSASKGCAELAIAAYRRSFFPVDSSVHSIASARAGNVIGGGDWAQDRIMPDIFRSLFANQSVHVRNKSATRPWQHVLEPLSGYLWLAACLDNPRLSRFPLKELRSSFNFGPSLNSNRTVAEVVEAVLQHVPCSWVDASDPDAPHEASKLNLAIDKAFHMLSWSPTWSFDETILRTTHWYQQVHNGHCPIETTSQQISEYERAAQGLYLAWAVAPQHKATNPSSTQSDSTTASPK